MEKIFSENDIKKVWEKGITVQNMNIATLRIDECGAWIEYKQYGNRESQLGWEIDHIKPISKGGTNSLENLRPLQWQNNAAKSDEKLICVVTAKGRENNHK